MNYRINKNGGREGKFGGVALLGIVAAFSAGIISAGSLTGSPEIYGPYVCSNGCGVASPVADTATAAFISQKDGSLNIVFNTREAGDQFVICNATHCVTYTRTDSGGFVGGGRTVREGSGGGGGGGNEGGGGNSGGGGGCVGSCGGGTGGTGGGGTVIVGPEVPVNPD